MRKLSLIEVQATARKLGGKRLSSRYANTPPPYIGSVRWATLGKLVGAVLSHASLPPIAVTRA